MGDGMTCPTTSIFRVWQSVAVWRFYRPAPLPHHPTPKGVEGWCGKWERIRSNLQGGANLIAFLEAIHAPREVITTEFEGKTENPHPSRTDQHSRAEKEDKDVISKPT